MILRYNTSHNRIQRTSLKETMIQNVAEKHAAPGGLGHIFFFFEPRHRAPRLVDAHSRAKHNPFSWTPERCPACLPGKHRKIVQPDPLDDDLF